MRQGLVVNRGMLTAGAVLIALLVPCAPAVATQSQFVGTVSDETYEALGAGLPSNADDLVTLGIGTVRQTFDWNFLSTGMPRGQLNFVWLDRYMAGMAARHVRVLPVLFNPPARLTRRPKHHAKRGTYPPRRFNDFARFGIQIARRYGRGGTFWKQHPQLPYMPITYYQVWNEPNLPVYWQPRPNARQYVKLLRATRRAIKHVDRNARIVTAGLPQSRIHGSISQLGYVKQIYRARGRGAFDVLGVNPYAANPRGVLAKLRQIRRTMNRYHDSRKQIWATEIGWADAGPLRKGRPVGFDVGASNQARFVQQVIPLLWRQRRSLRLHGFIYYALRDQQVYAGGKDFWGLHTGLKRLDGAPKPAWTAFQAATQLLK